MSGTTESADWTFDPETGRTNSSPLFRSLVSEVARLLGDGASGYILDRRWIEGQAQLIMAQLAHVHHLAPVAAEGITGTEPQP